ncbi:Aste57867_23169 [Aphanomyces stellatus]|uniref:Aste57867_23169 protein n=1 Tax=Aphanomyces stellatus TaxID=120398 RepID=A0A485LNP8_9STRA|nr:hypothetical protein As57867_023098 [Aphanomyces stellatus]VFT99817.1 Aste57867_23169 [Aphanomyces stellatus]
MPPHDATAESGGNASAQPPEVDLFLVCDTTASMGSYITSLASTIRQVFAVIKLLFRGRVKLHVVSYKDYCDGKDVITYCSQRTHTNKQMLEFVADLAPRGGGDIPEAIKTALNHVLATVHTIQQASTSSREAVVLIFTDAPPHHAHTGSKHWRKESDAIATTVAYTAGYDWMGIQRAFRDAAIPVFTFHSVLDCPLRTAHSVLFYEALGPVVLVEDTASTTAITKTTIGLLLQLMHQRFDFADEFTCVTCAWPYADDCEDALPTVGTVASLTKVPFAVAPLACMQEDLASLPHTFQTNLAYQEMVYRVFGSIFTPDTVLALTYNPVLGKLWRLCCTRRHDSRYVALSTKLSACIPALSPANRKQVQQWLEASHDESAAILETIQGFPIDEPCLVRLDTADDVGIDADDVRSLARAPNPGVISRVQLLLAHLDVLPAAPSVEPSHGGQVPDRTTMYLPLALPNATLFSYLAHLMHPGTTFSRRGAAVLAMICVFSNHTHLQDRANAFLRAIQGTWLPLAEIATYPEILSVEFIKLVHRGQAYLTSDEQAVYRQLYTVHRLRLAATKPIDVVVGATPTKYKRRPDTKARCHGCGFHVSLTLMATPDTCAMCVSFDHHDAIALQRRHVTPIDESIMVECSACHGLYAVVCPELLNIAPKCYYCRLRVKPRAVAPTVECSHCLNKYIDPSGLLAAAACNTWSCAACADDAAYVETRAIDFETLLRGNASVLARLFGWTKPKRAIEFVEDVVVDRRRNYFKLFTQQHALLFERGPKALANAAANEAHTATECRLYVEGKRVHDVARLCAVLVSEILEGSLHDLCMLCFDEFPHHALESACGRCVTRICAGCADHWFGQTKPGRVVLPTHLACPFCRQEPTAGIWKKFNKAVPSLLRKAAESPDKALLPKANMYYGWCISCGTVQPIMEKRCAQALPRPQRFECASCIAPIGLFPTCPGCNAITEKTCGCNHIECICGQHWCYGCGQGFIDGVSVYTHLPKCQGRLSGNS